MGEPQDYTKGRSGRAGPTPRCVRCAMHERLCLCAEIRPLELSTRVVIVTHAMELHRTTNTGRLAALALQNFELRIRGQRGSTFGEATRGVVDPGRRTLLLYPSEEAEVLAPDDADPRPVTLIVPDGNWSQARRVSRREPALKEVPRVRLPPGPPSRYRLRTHQDPQRLATLEAVARALGVLEGRGPQAELERVFTIMVERTLWTRGQLAAEKVSGGIPPLTPPLTRRGEGSPAAPRGEG